MQYELSTIGEKPEAEEVEEFGALFLTKSRGGRGGPYGNDGGGTLKC